MSTAETTLDHRAVRLTAPVGAAVFLGSYLAVDLVAGDAERPLPDAPATAIFDYVTGNATGVAMTGVMQLVSVLGLALFVHAVRRVRGTGASHLVGYAAVVAMCLSVTASFVTAAFGADLSASTVAAITKGGFYAGGVGHVVLLGTYVWLTRGAFRARAIRIFGAVAAVPAFLSLSSLLFYYGNAFILLGRLLGMAWIIVAAVAAVRGGVRRVAS
ncbi:hypothetical protein [Amycolatopsis albispora]|uniref:DUF4386 domain-containing protein n=1 Tax=Amycolatopsis albispora TaxID=1804986 RepID=A0A344LII1_9PSEU|nr:hypothetical protein [Amycolatopsis albispora]AXB47855.1 hypothetical protein A4R43_39895 [Amycolatopsis albispora]